MSGVYSAVIVSPTALLRKQLSETLSLPEFCIIASKGSLKELRREDIPHSNIYLLVVECTDKPKTAIAEMAAIKRWNAQTCIALLGSHFQPNEIVEAFQAGANAYFAEAVVSKDFLAAIQLIVASQPSRLAGQKRPYNVAGGVPGEGAGV